MVVLATPTGWLSRMPSGVCGMVETDNSSGPWDSKEAPEFESTLRPEKRNYDARIKPTRYYGMPLVLLFSICRYLQLKIVLVDICKYVRISAILLKISSNIYRYL